MTRVAKFYKAVNVAEEGGAFIVCLDGKPAKIPQCTVPPVSTRALADAIAEEWRAQGETIDPERMPLTRLAYAAHEVVPRDRERLEEVILGFGKSDLLCYRADGPAALVARQGAAWDPLLAWATERLGAKLATGTGISFVDQTPESQQALAAAVNACDANAYIALHGATTATGSLVLGLALLEGRVSAAEAFQLSRIDETFQNEAWGKDAEAEARAEGLARRLAAIARFLRLTRP